MDNAIKCIQINVYSLCKVLYHMEVTARKRHVVANNRQINCVYRNVFRLI